MITDLKFIVFEYLDLGKEYTLEQILMYFRNYDTKIIDILIYKNYRELPYIDGQIINGNLETVKFLYRNNHFECSNYILNLICIYGHLELLKYMVELGNKPTTVNINTACQHKNTKLVQYLFEKGIKPTYHAINWAIINGHFCVIKYLLDQNVRHTLSAEILNLTILKYPKIKEYLSL